MKETNTSGGSYIMLISIHGLIRGTDLELGRDADTGGQTKYVVELTRALIQHPEVEQVDLITRLVSDPRVDPIYAQEMEELAPGARIVRIACGPRRYIPKESLWPYLEEFVDNTVVYMRALGRVPDLVHGHYADAGYVASRLSSLLDMPMVFTGHSLGRVKRQRLLDQGMKPETIEKRYRIARRIEAEETALDHAAFVVTSTYQEVQEQYALYDHYQPKRMMVIPPAVNLSRFTPFDEDHKSNSSIKERISRFLREPDKPMILALARPDRKKNLTALIRAFGENRRLRETANLVIIAGNRDDMKAMDKGIREVLDEILYLVDLYDLYGQVAYPKHHNLDEVPRLYRLAAKLRGVFVNPALTEPFGLTLLEAAASGLPIVATHDGGPRDIIAHCKNGRLVDPQNTKAIGETCLKAITNPAQWTKWSKNGMKGVREHYSWPAHVNKYTRVANMAISHPSEERKFYISKSRLITADRAVITDIDNTLIGDRPGLERLLSILKKAGEKVAFGIATGRSIELTRKVLKEWKIPTPQLLITSVGTAIHYGPHLIHDQGWEQHISYRWRRDALLKAMGEFPGLELQPPEGQTEYKISFNVDINQPLSTRDVVRHLRRAHLQAKVIFSHGAYLDLLPIRASKGMALRYFTMKWGIPLEHCLVAGDSGNDEEMLTGNALGVVVGNYDPELEKLRENPTIFFAQGHHAWGIMEGIKHYDLLGEIRVPPANRDAP